MDKLDAILGTIAILAALAFVWGMALRARKSVDGIGRLRSRASARFIQKERLP